MRSEKPTDISPKVWRAFRSHLHSARRRGIPFLFTFEEWWSWWLVDDRWSRRGMGKNGLVMARRGDVGPYAPENVYCTTHPQNIRDIPFAVSSGAARRGALKQTYAHVKVRDGHPRAKPVITPAGPFANAALAAEHFGYSRQHAARLARRGESGWRYETKSAEHEVAPA